MMRAQVRSEVRKTLSTRLWWRLLLVEVAFVAFMAGALGFAFATGAGTTTGVDGSPLVVEPQTLVIMIFTVGVSFGYVFPVILGALAVTGEVRHGTLETTVALQPHRGRVIAAKFVAMLPFALAYALAAVATGVITGGIAFAVGDVPLLLDDPQVWRALGLGVLALTAWALVGVGFGTALTNQVAAIVVLLGFTQFVEPLVRIALAFVPNLAPIGAYLPGAAGDAIVGTSFYAVSGMGSDLLPWWAGLAVLLGYGAVAALIGWRTTFKADLT